MVSETGIQEPLRRLLNDRTSPEARALYTEIARYAHNRIRRLTRLRYPDLLSEAQQEEIVAESLYQLMSGALAQFRGGTLPELLGFVRTIADRCLWRVARRQIRERDTLMGPSGQLIEDWTSHPGSPEDTLLVIPPSPLEERDARYLTELLSAGSQADLARAQGVSRAAVTQRIQRIRRRIESLSPDERDTAEAWVRQTAARISST